MSDPDQKRGLYRKYFVQRLRPEDTGRDLRLAYETERGTFVEAAPPEKHERCRYYVLDLDHDRFAGTALAAYAAACEGEYPALAADLRTLPGAALAGAPAQEARADDGGDDCSTCAHAAVGIFEEPCHSCDPSIRSASRWEPPAPADESAADPGGGR